MNILLEIELNRMRHAELLAQAKHVRLLRQARRKGVPRRSSIARRLLVGVQNVTLFKAAQRILSPATNG